ncbi:histamine H3 receptor-like [Lissotriton helveticus]
MSLFANLSLVDQNGALASINNGYLFPFPFVIVLALLMSIMSLTTVLGNTLVIVAFILDKRLRHHSCYFLVNLAACDFFVGSFSIPWYIYPALTGRWPIGRFACKLWLAVDSTVCLSSVYSILLITYDRFLSVTKAVSYRELQGSDEMGKRALLQICVAWLVAFLLSAPAIFFWDTIAGYSDVPEGICLYEYSNAWVYLITTSLLEFYAPFIGIGYFNLSIYWSIRRRSVKRKSDLICDSSNMKAVIFSKEENYCSPQDRTIPQLPNVITQQTSPSNGQKQLFFVRILKLFNNVHTKETIDPIGNPETSDNKVFNTQQLKLKKDKQLAKSLAVIVGVYFMCWLPFTLIVLIKAVCPEQCIEPLAFEIAWWLLWMNSSINPFLYPLCHKKFRRAFKKLLSA